VSTSVEAPRGTTPAPAPAKPRLSDRARSERRLGLWLAFPAFIIMLAVTAYPILLALWESLFKYRLTAPADREFIGLGNYAVILTDSLFWRDLGVTLLITVITVVVELVLGFILALVMNSALKAVRGWLRTAILVPYGIITVVSAFAWFYAFDIDSGYINHWFDWVPGINPDLNWFADGPTALFVIMASEIWKTTPFISLLLLAGLAHLVAADVPGHPPEHEGGHHGCSALPGTGCLPHFRQRLHHDQRRVRDGGPLPARLPHLDYQARNRHGLGRFRAAVPLRDHHLLHRHQTVQGGPHRCTRG
jgi:hypothetical protein